MQGLQFQGLGGLRVQDPGFRSAMSRAVTQSFIELSASFELGAVVLVVLGGMPQCQLRLYTRNSSGWSRQPAQCYSFLKPWTTLFMIN